MGLFVWLNLETGGEDMINKAIDCSNCDSACYQTCTSCTSDCSSDCSTTCTATCANECDTTCSGCTGSCISTCTGTCSNTCTSSSTSDVININYQELTANIYSAEYSRPRIVKMSNDVFLMITGYSNTQLYSNIVAFKIDDEYNVTFGKSVTSSGILNLYYYDIISLFDINGSTIKQAIVVHDCETTPIIVFTINVDDELNITIGASSNIDTSATPTIQYKSYALGFSPSSRALTKLFADDDKIYFVSLSYAKQVSVPVGTISSNGIILNDTLDLDSLSGNVNDPTNNPELFFNSNLSNRAGVWSPNNCLQYNGMITLLSTSEYVPSGSNVQTYGALITFYLFSLTGGFQIYSVINSETPYTSKIHHLSGNFYVVLDELYAYGTTSPSNNILRVTPYEFNNGVFRQCGAAKIIQGLLMAHYSYSGIGDCTSVVIPVGNSDDTPTEFTLVVCAPLYDNIKHTRSRRYLFTFSCRIYDSIHTVGLFEGGAGLSNIDILSLANTTYDLGYPLNMTSLKTSNGLDYIIAVDQGNTTTPTVMLIKLSPNVQGGVMAVYKLCSFSADSAFYQKYILQELGDSKYRFLCWHGNISYGYASSYTVLILDLSPCDEDYKNEPIVTVIDSATLTTNTVDGTSANTIGCNNLKTSIYLVPEIFYDDIVCFVYSTTVYTYRWDRDDNKFYMLDKYVSNVSIPNTNRCYYFYDNWCRKYSDNELLLFDTTYKYYELLLITPTGKIIHQSYNASLISSNGQLLYNKSVARAMCKLFKHDDDLYILNPYGTSAWTLPNTSNMACMPVHIKPAFNKLSSYIVANNGKSPFGFTIDDSDDGQVCKTYIPNI